MTRAALCGRSFVALAFTTLLVTSIRGGSSAEAKQGPGTPNTGATAVARKLTPKAGRWTAALGPARERSDAYATVHLPKGLVQGDSPYGAALALASGKAAVFYVDSRFGKGTRTRALLCDVIGGRVIQQWNVNGIFTPLDVDSAGRRFLARLDQGGQPSKGVMELWAVAADNSLTQRRWVPYRDESEKGRAILWAGFVGDERIVTVSTGGKVIVWDAATLRPVCWAEGQACMPAVSPNGKYLAFLRPDAQVGLLDPTAGEVLGLMPLGVRVKDPALAFRPDGQALACVSEDRVIQLSIPTGQVKMGVVAGIKGRTAGGSAAVGWADERYLFINDFLVDPAVPMPLWSYHNLYWKQAGGGHVWFLASAKGMGDMALLPLRIPEPSVQAKLTNARADAPPMLLQPGDSVQVDVSQLPRERQREAQRTLEERLRHYEYRPAANAAVKLEARLGKEGTRQTSYSGGRAEVVTTRVVRAELSLTRDGKELWSRKLELTGGPPAFVLVQSGQSVASRIAGSSIPDYDRLKHLELPKFLQADHKKSRPSGVLGTTYVRPDGGR